MRFQQIIPIRVFLLRVSYRNGNYGTIIYYTAAKLTKIDPNVTMFLKFLIQVLISKYLPNS